MATAQKEKKSLEEHIARAEGYKQEGDDKEASTFFNKRKTQLITARQNILGMNIENLWRSADKAYVPHTLKTAGKRVFASDDELGWRSIPVTLGTSDDWQEDSVPPSPYVKVQTALSILIDRNPEAVFKAFAKKFEQSSLLHSELYKRNWDVAKSKQMLKVLILNGAKYGIITGMTKPLKIQRKVNDIDGESEVVTLYDDVYRWALNPWNCWFDDMAKPGDSFSLNDWIYYKDFSWERAREQFSHLANWKFVKPKAQKSGGTEEEKKGVERPDMQRENLVRIWYYENLERDMFYIETDDKVTLVNAPIPREPKNKRLSCWVAPWTLRHQDTVYGIGIYEAMKNDYKIFLKFRNMTIDQVTLSIYKEFFYEGTNTLQGTGDMRTKPGVGRQVVSPKNIVWNEVPGPGADSWKAMEFIQGQMDDATGITKTLEGELSPGAKAFDIAQAREAALKRMRTPLDNIAYALEQDAYLSVGLFEELYSIPEVEEILDPDIIADYRASVANGEINAEDVIDTTEIDEETGEEIERLEVNKFRTFPLNVDRDKEGNITQTREEKFFEIRPADLPWEGIINVSGQSVIAESPLLEKQEKLEMSGQLIPLFEFPFELVGNAAKQLLKIYNEDPEDWFPLPWLQAMEEGQQEQPPQLLIPTGGQQQGQEPQGQLSQPSQLGGVDQQRSGGAKGFLQNIVRRATNPFQGQQ